MSPLPQRIKNLGMSLLPPLNLNRLPVHRRQNAGKIRAAVCVVLYTIGFFLSKSDGILTYFIVSVSVPFFVCTVVDIFWRLSELWEEAHHINSRYNSYTKAFLASFPDSKYYLQMILSLMSVIVLPKFLNEDIFNLYTSFGPISLIFSFIASLLAFQSTEMSRSGDIKLALSVQKLYGMDYGTGIALSFFHGYLRILLPELEMKMRQFEGNQELHGLFPVYKLFILIPLSLYCPDSLENERNPGIEMAESMDPVVVTRAGVKARQYKVTVYKIVESIDRRVYFCAEYACPLLTLREVLLSAGNFQRSYEKVKLELVLNFYEALKAVLNEHPNCKEKCELMFFDDNDPNVTVKQMILDAVRPYRRQRF